MFVSCYSCHLIIEGPYAGLYRWKTEEDHIQGLCLSCQIQLLLEQAPRLDLTSYIREALVLVLPTWTPPSTSSLVVLSSALYGEVRRQARERGDQCQPLVPLLLEEMSPACSS